MNILYISQYYPPEMGAPSTRVSELSRYWVKMGHNVTVITGMPNHPNGIIHPTYKWEYFKEEEHLGIRVLRVFLYVAPNKGVVKRIISFLSFMITSLIVGVLMKTPDIIVATSPQLFVGFSGLVIAKIKRRPFVFEVRDIWPQSAVELKMLKNHTIISLMEKLEKLLYEKAQAIIVVVESMKEKIIKKSAKKDHIYFIPNGVDTERFEIVKRPSVLHLRQTYKDRFLIGFIGTIGINHNLSTILDAAIRLKDTPIHFIIVGEGADKNNIVKYKNEHNITNVAIYDKIDLQEVPYVLGELDAGIINQQNTVLAKHTLPAKMYEIFASGKPILAGIDGIGKDIILDNRIGYVFEPDQVEGLAAQARRLMDNPAECADMGKRAKEFVFSKFNRSIQAEEYYNILKKL